MRSHTAQYSRSSVTVYYSWHPLAGQTLSCKGHQPLPTGERAFICLLPDGTWSLLPEWMTSRERCARCQLVPEPHIGLDALTELMVFLRALRGRARTIDADATPLEKEARPDETTGDAEPTPAAVRVDGGMRWEDLPRDVHNQLVGELRAMLERAAQPHAAADGARSDRSE